MLGRLHRTIVGSAAVREATVVGLGSPARSHLAERLDPLWLSGRGAGDRCRTTVFRGDSDAVEPCRPAPRLLDGRPPAAARRATRVLAALHARLGDVRQERRPLAARGASASTSRTGRRTAASRTCSATCSSRGASSPRCGRRSSLTTGAGRRRALRLGRETARREGRLRREPRADRGPVAHLPADRADRRRAATCSGRSSPRTLPGRALRRQRLLGGRMIFVSVGTNEARFDRLLRAVAELPLDEELVVQHGHSARDRARRTPSSSTSSPSRRWSTTIRRARVVVTHAGVGSVMVSLANGKCPVVVPRRKAFGEAVDDHQLQLGRRFAAAGLVTLVEDAGRPRATRWRASSDRPRSSRARARSRPISRASSSTRSRVRWRRHRHDAGRAARVGRDRLPHPERPRLEGGLADHPPDHADGRRARPRAAAHAARLGPRGDGARVLGLRRRLHGQRARARR